MNKQREQWNGLIKIWYENSGVSLVCYSYSFYWWKLFFKRDLRPFSTSISVLTTFFDAVHARIAAFKSNLFAPSIQVFLQRQCLTGRRLEYYFTKRTLKIYTQDIFGGRNATSSNVVKFQALALASVGVNHRLQVAGYRSQVTG